MEDCFAGPDLFGRLSVGFRYPVIMTEQTVLRC
jgi:hypothetical protein